MKLIEFIEYLKRAHQDADVEIEKTELYYSPSAKGGYIFLSTNSMELVNYMTSLMNGHTIKLQSMTDIICDIQTKRRKPNGRKTKSIK
jgi:hypothetical protein